MNLQCPNCESHKTTTQATIVFAVGFGTAFIGALFSIILIGIPFLFFGLLVMVGALFVPKKHVCQICKYKWKPEKK